MPRVHLRPRGANQTAAPAASERRDSVRWNDPEDVKLWIFAMRGAVADGLGAGEDATRQPADRVLSRAYARRQIEEAEERIARLLDLVERGLAGGGAGEPK